MQEAAQGSVCVCGGGGQWELCSGSQTSFPSPPSPQVYPGGVGYIRIDGSTPDIKRKQAVDRFQAAAADGEPAEGSGGAAAAGSSKGRGGTSGSGGGGGTPPMRVALLSITAAGVGLTLTAAEVRLVVVGKGGGRAMRSCLDEGDRGGMCEVVLVNCAFAFRFACVDSLPFTPLLIPLTPLPITTSDHFRHVFSWSCTGTQAFCCRY